MSSPPRRRSSSRGDPSPTPTVPEPRVAVRVVGSRRNLPLRRFLEATRDATAGARRPAGGDFLVRGADLRARRRARGEGLPADRTRRVAVGKRHTPGATLGDDGLQGPAAGGVAEAATSE